MNKKFISYWILISGIIVTLIGIIHDYYTSEVYNKCLGELPQYPEIALRLAFFFFVAGTSVIFAGLLIIYASAGLKRLERWAWVIALSSSVYIFLFMIAAIIAGMQNILIYVATLCSFSNSIFLFIGRKAFIKIS